MLCGRSDKNIDLDAYSVYHDAYDNNGCVIIRKKFIVHSLF